MMETIKEIAFYFKDSINLEEDGFEMYEFDSSNLKYFLKGVKISKIFHIGFNYINPLHKEIAYAGFNAGLELSEVEDIINHFRPKDYLSNQFFNLPKRTIDFSELNEFNSKMWEELRPYFNKDLKNNKLQIEEFAQVVRDKIYVYLYSFWERYSILQNVNDDIVNKIPQKELHKYFGKMTAYKKLIIMKLCHNDSYEEYRNWLIETIEQNVKEDSIKWHDEYIYCNNLINYIENNNRI